MKNQEPTTKNHHALHPRTSASNRCRWDRPRSSGRRCGSATERRVSYTDDFRLAMTPSRPCCAAWSRALSPLMSSCSERRTKGRTACARNAEGLLEQLAAIGVREVAEVVAVEPEDVEEDDDLAVALLEELESRPPLFVEGDDLAVEHDLRHLQLPQRVGDFGEARREVDLIAAPHRHLPAGDRHDGAEAVVFELVDPLVGVARRRGGERRQHRREDFA